MESATCTESRSVTVPDILLSRLFCGEFDETPFMVEIGSFQQRLLEANTNEMALGNSIEIGRNECYSCLDVHSPNSNWPGATNFEYCSGAADIGVFHPFSNHSNNLELDPSSSPSDDANSLVKECHSTYTNALPSCTNLLSENIATRISSADLPVSMLRIVGGNSFVTQNTEDENRNVISKHYANYDKSWPEKGTTKDVERKCNKRKMVEQDRNHEIHFLKKKLCSGKRSVSNLPETSISGEMAVTNANNFLTEGSSDIGSSIGPHSVHSMSITAAPLHNTSLKLRSRRGTATDPQSVYARSRRERINRRLKLLQNLVPNGTKVDISTMLEQAIQYVKFMQLQIKLLTSDEHWMYKPISFSGMEFEGFQSRI